MSPIVLDIPVIETERLRLCAPSDEWLDPWAAFWASDRSAYVGGPRSRADTWRAIAAMLGHWHLRGFGMFAVTDRTSGTFYGQIGPWRPEGWPEREIGWILIEAAEGRGIGFEAAVAARAFAYDTLGWDTAVSYVHPDNARSRALAERLGAVVDPEAAPPDDDPCLVYRHPVPGGAAA
ncbi:MAG: GNAT family N-acetyltransferase [Paracoccaceae bacterium]